LDPTNLDNLIIGILFLSLLGVLGGIGTLSGFYLRLKFSKRGSISESFYSSFRQGMIFAIFIIGLLLFSHLRIFNWETAILFLLVLILIELILRRK